MSIMDFVFISFALSGLCGAVAVIEGWVRKDENLQRTGWKWWWISNAVCVILLVISRVYNG